MSENQIKTHLIEQLTQEHCLWSYAPETAHSISDEELMEQVLVYLDIDDIDLLLRLYPVARVKRVWRERMVPRDDYYHTLNRFLSWYYFGIRRPDTYLKQQQTRHFNRMMA